MKLLHDIDAMRDEKIRWLLHRHGIWGYGAFWVIVEMLARNGGRFDMMGDDFFPMMAEELRCKAEEAEKFIRDCVNVGLFRIEGNSAERRLVSDRCGREAEEYQRKSRKARESANARWSRVAESEKIASTFTRFLEAGRITRSQFNDELEIVGLSVEQRDRLWALSKEFSKHALGHYARAASAHLRANGFRKQDFVAYIEKWLLEDAAGKKGFFLHNTPPRRKDHERSKS